MSGSTADFQATGVSADDVASAVYALLFGDATLAGATYLTTSDNIWKSKPPRKADLPRVVIVASDAIPNEVNHYTVTVDIEMRVRNVGDGTQPDSSLLARLEKRLLALLPGIGTLTRIGFRFFDVFHEITGPVLAELGEPEESFQTARFSVDVRAS